MVPMHQTLVETSHGKPGWALTFSSLVNSDAGDENDVDSQEVNESPCKRCEKLKIQCLVQPEPKKLTSKDKRTVMQNRLACIRCHDSKNCCELASKRPRSPSPQPVSAPPWLDKEAKDTPAPPPRPSVHQRRKSNSFLQVILVSAPVSCPTFVNLCFSHVSRSAFDPGQCS